MTVEERGGQALLKRTDLTADRRLAQVQGLTRAGKRTRFGNRVKVRSLSQSITPTPPKASYLRCRKVFYACYPCHASLLHRAQGGSPGTIKPNSLGRPVFGRIQIGTQAA